MKTSQITLWGIILGLFCITANAKESIYIGIQGGYVNTNFNLTSIQLADSISDGGDKTVTSAVIKNHVAAIRGYGGYKWNDYFASEVGYLNLRNTRFLNINNELISESDIKIYGMDVRGKLFIPMAAFRNFSPYIQGGSIYLSTRVMQPQQITASTANNFGYTIHPLFGAGIAYRFNDKLSGDISWTSIPQGNTNVPRLDMFLVALNYHLDFQSNNTNFNYGQIP